MLHLMVNVRQMKYSEVCSFYNSYKEKSWNPLTELNRDEKGFCIPICNKGDIKEIQNDNTKIKQVRWMRNRLVTPKGLTEFSLQELTLLYKSIAHVHGEENVFLEC